MNNMIKVLIMLITMIPMGKTMISAKERTQDNNNGMIVRISEIEVYQEYLDEYLNYAAEVAQVSVEKEKDVISIYPMQLIKNDTQIRILEIYRNQKAYENHIASAHFRKYKEKTLHMVKHLDLIDTYQLCPTNFNKIFKKSD